VVVRRFDCFARRRLIVVEFGVRGLFQVVPLPRAIIKFSKAIHMVSLILGRQAFGPLRDEQAHVNDALRLHDGGAEDPLAGSSRARVQLQLAAVKSIEVDGAQTSVSSVQCRTSEGSYKGKRKVLLKFRP
jgi:hypothetical protein